MKVTYISIFTIALILMSGIPLISSGATNYANARPVVTSPQTQGDGTANSPTNLQISKSREDPSSVEPPSEGPPSAERVFSVVVRTVWICPTGFQCPFYSIKAATASPEATLVMPDLFAGDLQLVQFMGTSIRISQVQFAAPNPPIREP